MGENLVRARRLQLLKQQVDVAERAGVSVRTVQRAERGERLSSLTKARIAIALGSRPDELWPRVKV